MNEWWSCMPLNFTIETLLTVSISVCFDHCSTHTSHTWLSASQPLYHYDNSVRLLCLSISGYFCSALSWHSWRVLFSLLLFPVFCCFQYFLAKPKSQTKKVAKSILAWAEQWFTKLRVRLGFDIDSRANRISSAISIRFVIYALNNYSNVKILGVTTNTHFETFSKLLFFLFIFWSIAKWFHIEANAWLNVDKSEVHTHTHTHTHTWVSTHVCVFVDRIV